MDCGWNWIFGDLETFLTIFFILGSKVNFPTDENRLSHNASTRRIDPHPPEGPWIFPKAEINFVIFNFPDLGPRALGPMGPRAHGPRPKGPTKFWWKNSRFVNDSSMIFFIFFSDLGINLVPSGDDFGIFFRPFSNIFRTQFLIDFRSFQNPSLMVYSLKIKVLPG